VSCENFYSKIYDKKIKEKTIYCVSFEGDNSKTSELIKNTLIEEGINVKQNCSFSLKATYKLLSQCNSPTGKSIGADFDGFLRFELFERGKLVYRCQMDWKGEFGKDRVKDLIEKMKEDLKFGR
jgi:hypothetical protein